MSIFEDGGDLYDRDPDREFFALTREDEDRCRGCGCLMQEGQVILRGIYDFVGYHNQECVRRDLERQVRDYARLPHEARGLRPAWILSREALDAQRIWELVR